VVANPVDILTQKAAEWMDMKEGRVFGTGCILDTSRLIRRIADYTNLNIEAIKCDVVGEHGDTQFPVWSRLSIAGIPMSEYCANVGLEWNEDIKEKLYKDVRSMGATIIRDKGRTHYGIATCVCSLADAVLNQRLTIAPVTSPLQGEYGINDVAISIPSIVGVNGVERRLEERLVLSEIRGLRKSAGKIRETLDSI
jgi:L-lactate dehydrogenase